MMCAPEPVEVYWVEEEQGYRVGRPEYVEVELCCHDVNLLERGEVVSIPLGTKTVRISMNVESTRSSCKEKFASYDSPLEFHGPSAGVDW